MAGKPEEEFRRLSFEMRILQGEAEALKSRINMIGAVIADLTYANLTLNGLGKRKAKAELLVPIGGSSYIKAKLQEEILSDMVDFIERRLGKDPDIMEFTEALGEEDKSDREELEGLERSL